MINKFILALMLSVFAFAALAHAMNENIVRAQHQPKSCNLYEVFANVLANQYGETLIDAKKNDRGGRYEIWHSENTHTWTLMEIMPDGMNACIIGSGIMESHTPDELMQRQALGI